MGLTYINCNIIYLFIFSTKDKALPYITSLVKRATEDSFRKNFEEIRDSPLIQELPIKSGLLKLRSFSILNLLSSDQRLCGFYALLFTWMAELEHEFEGFFNR